MPSPRLRPSGAPHQNLRKHSAPRPSRHPLADPRRDGPLKGPPPAPAATLVACLFAPPAGAVEPPPPSGVIDLAKDADAVLSGAAAGDRTGWAVARTGDVNGDGVPDLAVGAPLADPAGRTDAG